MGKRLHIGASSLELLSGTPTSEFIDQSWVHLGDPPNHGARSGSRRPKMQRIVKYILRRGRKEPKKNSDDLYKKTDFRPWIYAPGDKLDFENDSISFIYSEHMLEHFRYDVAVDLLRELLRILEPGAVARIVVPDADYRTYEHPEPVGYPDPKLPFEHPNKHKVRWNVYLLTRTLEMVGFEARPVVWCDEKGEFHEVLPTTDATTPEAGLVDTLRYVQRPRSLIVDGIKR